MGCKARDIERCQELADTARAQREAIEALAPKGVGKLGGVIETVTWPLTAQQRGLSVMYQKRP